MGTRVVRLFPDYGRSWPLWENGTEKYAMDPDDYGLSDELRSMMRRWHGLWERHFDPFDGWDTADGRQAWADLGRQVEAVLRREVGDFATVSGEWRHLYK